MLWRTDTRLARSVSPIITDSCVLLFTTDAQATSNQLECYDKEDGSLLSSTAFELPNVHISAVLDGGPTLVVFHSRVSTQSFGAVGLRAGNIVWRQSFSSETRKAVLAPDGSFYRLAKVPTTNDVFIERRRLSDGQLSWSAPASTTHDIIGQYHVATNSTTIDVAAFGTNQQTAKPEWLVQRIDAESGSPTSLTVAPSYALSRGNNGVAMFADQIYAAEILDTPPTGTLIVRAGDASTGVVQWQRQFDSLSSFDETPTVTASADFLTVRNVGEVFRLSRSNGALIWQYRNPGIISAVNAQDLAYITLSSCPNCQEVKQLNAAGTPQLSIPNASAIGTIERDVVTLDATRIVRHDAAGNSLWVLPFPMALVASGTTDNHDIYLLHRQFGQITKVTGATGEMPWSAGYGSISMPNTAPKLRFLGDGTAFVRISGTGNSYFRIALGGGETISTIFPPLNVQLSSLLIPRRSDRILAPARSDSAQDLLGHVDKSTFSLWHGAQNFTSPKITDLIGMDRSDSVLWLAPDGGIIMRRDHYFESNTDQSQIWLERYPPPAEVVAGEFKLTQINNSNNTFSDGTIKLRVHNNSTQVANNIAFSAKVDRFLECRKSSGLPCDLRRTDVGSFRFDLTQNDYADFHLLRVVLPNCGAPVIAQIQPASEYVDTTINDNRLEIRLCDRFNSGFE